MCKVVKNKIILGKQSTQVNLSLNHWSHMDCFNDFFPTFLGLERVSCVAVNGGKASCQDFIKILHLYSEDQQKSSGLEWHDGK